MIYRIELSPLFPEGNDTSEKHGALEFTQPCRVKILNGYAYRDKQVTNKNNSKAGTKNMKVNLNNFCFDITV